MTNLDRAEKIFANCFTKEEFDFLSKQSEFIQAALVLETMTDIFNAVGIGEHLIKESGGHRLDAGASNPGLWDGTPLAF